MRRLGWPVVLGAMVLLPVMRAEAGRRLLAWPYDTETIPERGVELEQWLWERANDDDQVAMWLWWAPVIGITDQVEVAFPIEWQWLYGLPMQLEDYGVDLRWRLAPPKDADDSWPVVPLLRAGAKRYLVEQRNGVGLEADLVLSADVEDRVHFVLDVGVKDLIQGGDHTLTVDVFAGGTVLLGAGLRVGATFWASFLAAAPGGDEGVAYFAAGPDLSWSHGRFWITAGMPIVVHNGPGLWPRITWGILF